MKKQPMLKNFTSEIDEFLQAFDKQHPQLSLSQQKEINKYNRIDYLRDHANRFDESSTLWEGF